MKDTLIFLIFLAVLISVLYLRSCEDVARFEEDEKIKHAEEAKIEETRKSRDALKQEFAEKIKVRDEKIKDAKNDKTKTSDEKDREEADALLDSYD